MLKGVSHRIIEVNHPDSLYFERAVFYLRPEADDLPVHAALCETERYLAPGNVRRHLRVRGMVWFLLGAAVTGILWLVLHLAGA
jgi:hypothetical protein